MAWFLEYVGRYMERWETKNCGSVVGVHKAGVVRSCSMGVGNSSVVGGCLSGVLDNTVGWVSVGISVIGWELNVALF